MKTKFLILSFFLLISVVSKAQHYFPLPDSNATWVIEWDDGFGGNIYSEYYTDSINKDTIINLKTYTKIFSGMYYQGAYRSDTLGFTYFVPFDSLNEYVSMNFNKNTGDTINDIFISTDAWLPHGYLASLYVDSINYVQCGPYSLKRMFLSNDSLFSPNEPFFIWVEKIGTNTWGLFNHINEFAFGAGFLYCMNYNDTIYYQNSHQFPFYSDPVYYSGQCIIPVDVENYNKSKSMIHVAPNPFSDKISFQLFNYDEIYNIKIYNTLGQVVFNKENINNTNEQTLNLSFLKPDIYFLTLFYSDHFYKTKIVKR